jgi:conserved oligomeric Golgi complex subunit 5
MAALKAEYVVFANPDFDPNEFANSILSGDALKSQAEPPAKEDISEAIAKLDAGVDDVSKQIKGLVSRGWPLLDHHVKYIRGE